jgi:hypothetical protein
MVCKEIFLAEKADLEIKVQRLVCQKIPVYGTWQKWQI